MTFSDASAPGRFASGTWNMDTLMWSARPRLGWWSIPWIHTVLPWQSSLWLIQLSATHYCQMFCLAVRWKLRRTVCFTATLTAPQIQLCWRCAPYRCSLLLLPLLILPYISILDILISTKSPQCYRRAEMASDLIIDLDDTDENRTLV